MGIIPLGGHRVKATYRVLIVRPSGEFKPTNWRNRPESFTVLRSAEFGDTPFRGRADAFRFTFNKEQLSAGVTSWAILETLREPTKAICQCCGVLMDMSSADMAG